MERKFDSELAKQFAEGKSRRTYKPLGLAVAAVAVMALFTGAAVFSLAMTAKAGYSPTVDEDILLDGLEDSIMVTDMDLAAKRVVTLKYRAVSPPADGDQGMFRITYAVNLMIKADGSGLSVGDSIGNLNIDFTTDIVESLTTISATTEVIDPLGVTVFYAGAIVVPDEADALDVVAVTAAIPVLFESDGSTPLTLAPGYTVSVKITIDVDDTPGLSGVAVEQPFPMMFSEDAVSGTILYDFEAYSRTFPVVADP